VLGSTVRISSAGAFSLSDKLTWDGTTLSITGNITVSGGNAATTTQVSAAQTAADNAQTTANGKISSGGAASDVNSNTTNISGGKIRTGIIESTGYSYSSGDFSSTGTQINLDNGLVRSKNFVITSAGDAKFRGNIEATGGTFSGNITSTATIEGGTIQGAGIFGGQANFGDGNFIIRPNGDAVSKGSIFLDNTSFYGYSDIFNNGWFGDIDAINFRPIYQNDFFPGLSTPTGGRAKFGDNYIVARVRDDFFGQRILDRLEIYGSTASNSVSYGTFITGNVFVTGTVTQGVSDDRLKRRLGNIENPLAKIKSLNGFRYKLSGRAIALGLTNTSVQVGVSAQEVEKVLPEAIAVAPIDEEFSNVHYERLIPLLIEGIKELTNKVESLESKITELEAKISGSV
jgi:hypothetical protein